MSEAEVLEPTNAIATVDPGTNIVEAVAKQPGIVLLDREKFSAWYEKLKSEAPTDVDVSTAKGRDALRSFAARVRSEKAAIDKERLRLTADWRDMVKQANDAGNEIREQLDALAAEVRKPLTEWEEAEKAREAEVDRIIGLFRSSRFVPMGEASDSIRERGTIIHEIAIDPDLFRDRAEEAEKEKRETVEHLFAALKAAEQAEAAAIELERLKREAAEREEAERAKREAEEAEARRAEEERRAEEARIAAEQAEKERLARAEQEAAERARREAEEAAQRERDEERRKHEAALAAERERAERAEAEAQAERDRIAAEEAERRAAEEREAQAKAKREADQAHRTAVKTKAKEALITCGADEETAKKIVLAIIAGEVPSVWMEF
jgi:hypothetical protein